jgi:nonribosomal peptide synthetase MxcG
MILAENAQPQWSLSAAQHGIWLGQQLDLNSPRYNTAECLEILGAIETARFEQALRQTISEAESLHLRFNTEAEQPIQSIAPSENWVVHHLDFSTMDNPWQSAQTWMSQDLSQTVDLRLGPLFSQALIRTAPERYLWYQRIHHIAMDGYGFSLLARRVAEIYTALSIGQFPGASPFTGLYRVLEEDFAYSNSAQIAQDRSYWLERLANTPEPTSLSEQRAPASTSFLRCSDNLPPAQVERLQATALQFGASWADFVLATISGYLYLTTGATELILGLPVMGRLGSAALRVPTMVMNIVPLQVSVQSNMTFSQLSHQIGQTLREIRPHQRYRYEQLRRDLKRVGSTRRLFGPVVNIMPFNYALRFAGNESIAHNISAGPVEDLSIGIYARGDDRGVQVNFDANPTCYDLETLTKHQRSLFDLLQRAVDSPEADIGAACQTQVMFQKSRTGLLNGEPLSSPPRLVLDRITEQVSRSPRSMAVIDGDRSLCYQELLESAQRLGARLRDAGAKPGQRVAIYLSRSSEAIIAVLGVLISGAAYLALDPQAPATRNATLLEDAAPSLLLTNAEHAPILKAISQSQQILIEAESSALSPTPLPPSATSDLAYVVYTSGSTGTPKGVTIDHGALASFVEAALQRYAIRSNDRMLQFAPLHFDASVEEIFLTLCVGATLVLRNEAMLQSIPRFLTACDNLDITVLDLPTAFWHELVFSLTTDQTRLPRALHTVIIGGEAALPERVARWQDAVGDRITLLNTYGPSEATVVATAATLKSGDTNGEAIPIGHLLPGLGAAILDPNRQPVAFGQAGELYLLGPTLACGYLGRPDLTAERFVKLNTFPGKPRAYRTGDRVRLRSDGQLIFIGRIDEEFKISGHRVDPTEIETALLTMAGVREAVVVGHSFPNGIKRLCAHIVADPPHQPASILRHHLASILPAAMVPTGFVFTDRLPKTATGKLDRGILRNVHPEWIGTAELVPPTPLESIVLRVWQEVLVQDGFSIQDDFFELGGQSLQTIQVANRLGAELGHDISVSTIFQHPTAAELSRALAAEIGIVHDLSDLASRNETKSQQPSEDQKLLVPMLAITTQGENLPLFCVHPAAGISWCYVGLARYLGAQQPLYGLQSPGLDYTASSNRQPSPPTLLGMAEHYLELIQQIQPQGPYHLLGWSVGGIIAQTIATLLQRQGEAVALLALLDAYPSYQWRDRNQSTESEALAALLQVVGNQRLAPSQMPQEREEMLALLRHENPTLARLNPSTLAALLETAKHNINIARQSPLPDRYRGQVVCFTAKQGRTDPRLTHSAWHPFIEGTIENHDLDCDHAGIMENHCLQTIAQVLVTYLSRTNDHSFSTINQL